jgi:diguanylate cyclase (GGDEF)-like protein
MSLRKYRGVSMPLPRELTLQTNYPAWRLAALALVVCFATSLLAVNNAGAALSILGMSLVAVVADRKLTDLTGRSDDAIRALTDHRARLENARATLEQERATLLTAINNMSQGLTLFDVAEQLVMCNERYLQMYRMTQEAATSCCSLRELLDCQRHLGSFSGDVDTYLEDLRSRLRTGRESRGEIELPDGRTIQIINQPLAGGGWVATHDDVTEQRRAAERTAFLAHHDALTGLANRATISQRIEDAAARERRTGEPFTVLLLDLDRFKEVNDTLGHAAGDALLCEVAARLKGALRETDALGRLGGDEFVVIQSRAVNPVQAATAFAMRIVELLSKPFHIERQDVSIGTSIGIAIAPEHASDPANLLKMADLALYRAKSAGRATYAFFSPEMTLAASERRELEMELRHAISAHELELHYQPIVDAASMKVTAAEALLRWRHPHRGLLSPDKFLPIAEESGLIAQIGRWVLETACRQAATWPGHIKLAVNVSSVQLRKASFEVVVKEALAEARLAPERLELEISETALIKSVDCLPLLQKLKELGVTMVLDDFGTGQLTLSQLPTFPFDKIKIDSSFIGNMTEADYSAIIDATLTFAKRRRMTTTAEGVETKDQLGMLREAGVTAVQGYLFERPALAGYFDLTADYGMLTADDEVA